MPSSSHDVADPILLYVPVCLSYTYMVVANVCQFFKTNFVLHRLLFFVQNFEYSLYFI